MAIIAVAGGIYLWCERVGLPATTAPWITGAAVASVLTGVLLWLRVPAIKWLGLLVFVAISGLGLRRLLVNGWSFAVIVGILCPVVCAFWMGRIDYSHKFIEE